MIVTLPCGLVKSRNVYNVYRLSVAEVLCLARAFAAACCRHC